MTKKYQLKIKFQVVLESLETDNIVDRIARDFDTPKHCSTTYSKTTRTPMEFIREER